MIEKSLLDVIGNTPLVKINLPTKANIYAKLEYCNPGGSVKDRSALYMIQEAQKKGLLQKGGTIIEASSGNQGIAAAMIGAALDYKVIITVSEKVSTEKLRAIAAYGARVIICPSVRDPQNPSSYQSVAMRIHQQTPNSFLINQYFNMSNRLAHYHLLGPEIWQQTDGTVSHFFAAAGTGGTIAGVGAFLKEKNNEIVVCGADSANSWRSTNGNPQPYMLEGIGVDLDSPVIDYSVIDQIIPVTDADGLNMIQLLACKGFLVGPSSGAVAWAACAYEKFNQSDIVVMIFGDSGRAYLTKNFYQQETEQYHEQCRETENRSLRLA